MTIPLLQQAGNQSRSKAAPRGSSAPPADAMGYQFAGTPGWGYFGAGGPSVADDIPELKWPNNIHVYHKMRTDTQVDALIKSVTYPLRRLNWMISPNGARDEVIEDISNQFGLPIKGNNDDFVIKGRQTFDHDNHLRLALLAPTVYGHLPFELVGDVDAGSLAWHMTDLAPLMPQTIAKFDVARNGLLNSITQFDPTNWSPEPIPSSQLACYTWELEGGNWAGRSMLRTLYKHWLLKDRLYRIDAIKNERFGAGIPKGTAPVGGDPADYQKMASALRASETGGVGVANGGDISIEGVRGTLPDTIGSIKMHDEAMARSFLAMFMQLGQTESGSRALGDSFVDFFSDSLWAFVKWYSGYTNKIFYQIVDWNYGEDEQSPLLVAEEKEGRKLDATDLSNLIRSGALVVDVDMQNWIRKEFDMPEYTGGDPLPTKPETAIQINPAGTGDAVTPDADPTPTPAPISAGGTPSKGTPKDKRLKKNKAKVTRATELSEQFDAEDAATFAGHGHVRVVHPKASSQTANSTKVGHRQPTAIEATAGTDFDKLDAAWKKQTTSLVDSWGDVRDQQIEELLKQVTAAVKAGDSDALANIQAPVLGDDAILTAMKSLATTAIKQAVAEAKSQGKTLTASVDDISDELESRSKAIAQLMANGISQSAATQSLLRYGVAGVTPADVAKGVGAQLDSLSDSYLNDVLGGALTQAQNAGRRQVFAQDDSAKIYSSELLDENTCEECTGVDGTDYDSMADASEDYPAGGYVDCLGGPRCRGTLVAVYGEGDNQ